MTFVWIMMRSIRPGAPGCWRKQTMPARESEAQSCMIGHFGNVISVYGTDKWISVGAVAIDGRSEEDTRFFEATPAEMLHRVFSFKSVWTCAAFQIYPSPAGQPLPEPS